MIEVKKLSKDELEKMNVFDWPIWTKEESEFDWYYSDKESCYIIEGDVEVKTDAGSVNFKAGDFVTVNGESGTIKNVGISITELDTLDNKHIIIPNKAAWGGNITNFTRNPTRRVDLEMGVGYDDDLDKVIKTTMGLLKADKRVLTSPEPQVAVKEMADSAVVFVIRPWVKTEDYWDFFFDFQKALKQKYDKEGISIPFPQRDVHLFQNK